MKNRICFLLAAMILIISVCTACAPKEPTSSEMPQSSSAVQSEPVVSPEPSAVSTAPEPVSQGEPEAEEPEPELTEREKKWRGDLSYFKRNYVMYHPDPFYYVSEEELDRQLEQLVQKIPELSDNDIYFELAKIVAGLKDSHTFVIPGENIYARLFPFVMGHIGDKMYLTAYWENFDQFEPYLLHEIVSVNGVDIKYLQQKAESISDPTNQWRGRHFFDVNYHSVTAFFDWAGCDYKEGYTIELLDDDQEVISVEVPVITQDADVGEKRIRPEGWENILYYNQKEGATLFETEQGSCVILTLDNPMEENEEFYQQIFSSASALLAEHPDTKLVVDLRGNGGGLWKSMHAVERCIPLLKQTRTPQTYVLTDGYTMSAAVILLNTFKKELDAIQVGEPTGQFFQTFSLISGSNTVLLPSSQICVRIAHDDINMVTQDFNAFYDEDGKLYEWENTVLPDVYISQTIEDTKAGKDSMICPKHGK